MKSLLAALLLLVSSSAFANLVKYDGNPPGFDIGLGVGVMGFTFYAAPNFDPNYPFPIPLPNLVMIQATGTYGFMDFYDPHKSYPSDFVIFPGILYGQDAIQGHDTFDLRIYGNEGGSIGGGGDYTDGARWMISSKISYYLEDGLPPSVPLPATLPLMASAVGILGLMRRKPKHPHCIKLPISG